MKRRVVRFDNHVKILKVMEEKEGNIVMVVRPWEQKYYVSEEYLEGIDIDELQEEFKYCIEKESVSYITGSLRNYVVFPRTSKSKLIRTICAIKIRTFVSDSSDPKKKISK